MASEGTKWRIFWFEIVSGTDRASLFPPVGKQLGSVIIERRRYGKFEYDFALFLFVLLDSFCVILPVSIISISPDWLTSVWLTLALATHQRGLGEHHTSLILQKKVNLVTFMFSIFHLAFLKENINAANSRTFLSTPSARPSARRLC